MYDYEIVTQKRSLDVGIILSEVLENANLNQKEFNEYTERYEGCGLINHIGELF